MSRPEYEAELKKLMGDIKEKNLASSPHIALASVRLIKKLIGESRWSSASELLSIVKDEYKRLHSLMPSETIVKNIWNRVIKIIQDESVNLEQSSHSHIDSLQNNLFQTTRSQVFVSESDLKPIMIEAISEIINEIETSVQNISAQSLEHIHTNEIVLTIGKSNTVEAFLKSAARKRKFYVIIAEAEPYLEGHDLASNLSKVGLDVTVIPDSAIFAVISRVNKVIIGTKSIFANGGLKAKTGTHALALAAKHHNIPLIVCASSFKLSVEHFCNSNNLSDSNPADDILAVDFHPNVSVLNPSFDYVPPELITLFIFNTASNPPSYVYRLLREMYPSEDDF